MKIKQKMRYHRDFKWKRDETPANIDVECDEASDTSNFREILPENMVYSSSPSVKFK